MKWEQAGTVGVDAGLMWVGDPCYVIHADPGHPQLGKTWSEFCDLLGEDYPTIKNFDGLGVAVSSGYGDGEYPVFVKKNREGRVIAVQVRFDDNPAED